MTQAEKLEALVRRAVDRDLDLRQLYFDLTEGGLISSVEDFMIWLREGANNSDRLNIIFNHDFARALFGDDMAMFAAEDIKKDELGKVNMPGLTWAEYHLQQAVISEDPIDYFYKVVFDK